MSWYTLVVAFAMTSAVLAGALGAVPEPEDDPEHVHMVGIAYDPQTLTVAPGTTVEWDNHDSVQHTVTAEDGSWDSGSVGPGETYSRVFDELGTHTYFCAVHAGMEGTIIVENPPPPGNTPPTAAITSPEEGAVVTGLVDITGTAADSDGNVTRVEVAVDGGAFTDADGTTSWSFALDTTPLAEGVHTVTARAFDGEDFSGLAFVNLTVEHPRPTIAITAPAEGGTVTGFVTVTGTAAAATGDIGRVEVSVDDGPFERADGTTEWTFGFDSNTLPDGDYTVTARAFDALKGSTLATLNLTVEHPRAPDVTVSRVLTRGNALQQTLQAQIGNVGEAPASAFDVRFYYEYKDRLHLIDSVTVPGLATGAESMVSVQWDTALKVGSFPIVVHADEADLVNESDETNNRGESVARVGAGLPPRDLTDP